MKMVLVDTNIWSTFLRRRKSEDLVLRQMIFEMINSYSLKIIGPIRQEILAGIRDPEKFELLRLNLASFRDEPILTQDYEYAAKFQNLCASKGLTASAIDAIIVSVAVNRSWAIFSRDKDFVRYKSVVDFELIKEQ
jgi:predicted nucleic acid-binding protein